MFSAHTQNKQQELGRCLFKLRHTCVINSVIGKGIEPHPTNDLLRFLFDLSIDTETHDAFTISDTLSCRVSEAGFAISPHSLPILYQI